MVAGIVVGCKDGYRGGCRDDCLGGFVVVAGVVVGCSCSCRLQK